MKKIIFVCTGNYYRSKFAEIYFNHRTTMANVPWRADSAGFDISNPNNKGLASHYVFERLAKLNIPIPEDLHGPQMITRELLLESDIVIGLNQRQHQRIAKILFSEQEPEWGFWNIPDRKGKNLNQGLEKVQKAIDELFDTKRGLIQSGSFSKNRTKDRLMEIVEIWKLRLKKIIE